MQQMQWLHIKRNMYELDHNQYGQQHYKQRQI